MGGGWLYLLARILVPSAFVGLGLERLLLVWPDLANRPGVPSANFDVTQTRRATAKGWPRTREMAYSSCRRPIPTRKGSPIGQTQLRIREASERPRQEAEERGEEATQGPRD